MSSSNSESVLYFQLPSHLVKINVFRIDDSPNVYLLKNDGFLTRSTYIVLIHEFDISKPGE